MADSDDCQLVLCEGCNELFPASGFQVHAEFCRKFMRLLSREDVNPEVIQVIFETGVFPPDLALSDEEEESYEDALCNKCDSYFPKKHLKEHQALCRGVQLEHDAGYKAFLAARETLYFAKHEDIAKEEEPKKRPKKPQDTVRPQVVNEPTMKKEADARAYGLGHERKNADKVPKAPAAFNQSSNIPKTRPAAEDSFRNDVSQKNFQSKVFNLSDEEDKAKTNPIFDENRTFNIPYSPLLNYYVNQAGNEECSISDDEDGETLEDFWRKGQEAIDKKRLKAQN